MTQPAKAPVPSDKEAKIKKMLSELQQGKRLLLELQEKLNTSDEKAQQIEKV